MNAQNNPNTVYVAAYYPNQPQKNSMQPGQSEQPQQQVYMQPGVDEKQVVVPIKDMTENTAFTLLIIGICVPFVWLINACMHWKSPNPKTKKYAKISFGLAVFELLVITVCCISVYFISHYGRNYYH